MSSPAPGDAVEAGEAPAPDWPPPDPPCIGLKEVYSLLNRSSRVSRNVRAQWYFSLLAQDKFAVHKYESIQDFQDRGEMDIVGLVPEEARPVWEWDWDVSHLYNYRLTPLSQVHFLSQRYSSVFVLDLSPSSAAQDSFLTSGALDKFLSSLREALVNLARPFYIPGSQLLFKPDIFVTVMAWTPFLTSTTYLVLKQGWLLTSENVDQLLAAVIRSLLRLEEVVSDTNSVVQDDIATIRSESERMMGALFDHPSQPPLLGPSVHVSSSDSAFVSMIKAAVLGLQLLPTNTTSSIIYIGDAIMSLPDIDKCDSVLNSLRTLSISLSFLTVLDRSHADASLTNGPNFDLLKFIALSTYGTFLTELPKIHNEDYVYNMNAYHEAFLCWSFRKTLDQLRHHQMDMLKNKYFLSVDNLGVQKILNMDVKSCFTSVLSCRLREGYLMSHVNVSSKESRISVVLTLPWKISSSIHYKLSSPWPLKSTNETKVELQLEGDYDIIHDIICQRDKYFDSGERNSIIRKFYVIVTHLTRVDRLLAHLESFAKVKANYSIPDTIAGGIPLFHVPPNMQKPELYQVDPTSGAFVSFWRPICSLDINVWHRWMHTHRVNALMHHDYPWPKHLLSPNSSGRYTIVQSRKAMSQLTNVLKANSSFTLVEGQSYVKFLFKEEGDKVPFTFYIIRLTCNPPCVVIWVAFLGGTSGVLRHHEVQNLKQSLSSLTITQSNPWKFNHEVTEQNACTQIQKPLDKVLIRYLNAPKNVECMIDPELFNSAKARSQSPGPLPRKLHSVSPMGGFFITLTQYLTHVRWVWNIVDTSQRPVVCSPAAVARILQMVIKIRLLQGFFFAYSKNGVQNLVSEIQAKHEDESPQPFILQYIVYPLSSSPSPSVDFSTDEGEDIESIVADREACTTLISEVWVEPQNGEVVTEGPFEGCQFIDISKVIFGTDHEVIALHATIEHLAVVCQKSPSTEDMIEMCHRCFNRSNNEDVSAKRIQISTDIVGLAMASPKVEMRFSSFIQSFCLTPDFIFKHDLNQCEKLNRANDRLFTAFHEELVDLFDYEQTLTGEESRRIGDFLATSCPDLKVQFATKRHEIDEEIEDLPRWKCYAKGNGKGHVLVTFLPYAHSDLKELLLSEGHELNDKNPNLQMSKTPMPDQFSGGDSFSSENQSILSFDSRKNSFSGFSSNMLIPNSRPQDDEALTRVRSQSLIRIRKRTQTIDNSDAIAFGRRRRNSTHTNKVHHASKRTDCSPAKRSRTHTFSNMKGIRSERNASAASSVSKDETLDCSSFHPCQEHVAGSVAIPMYTFSCSEKHLLTFLMSKNTKPNLHKSLDLRWKPEESEEPAPELRTLGEQPDEFDPTFLKRIEKRFYKAFVSVLYGSLQQGAPIHNDDVQQAVDLCDVESVVEVKLNDFLASVCPHTLEKSHATGERQKKCFENFLNHEVMRKKFSDILQKSFKNVPGPSEFYFYRNLSREQQKPTPCSAAVIATHRQRRNTRDTSSTRDDDTSHFHLEVDHCSSRHEHEDQSQISGYISPRGDDQLSLCSNMVSELSDSNDWPGDIPLDNPLFFQISLIAQGDNNFFLNLPITHLPSCYLDLANDLRQAIHEFRSEDPSPSDADQIPANLMLKLNVTLISCDFQDTLADGILEPHLMTPHILEKTDYIGKHQLNTIQRKAISEMVEDIHWMITDEIAFSKASSTHITQAMLKAIVAHVEASISKPGCSIVKCPLDFIMNREKSMEVMMEQISRIALPNFKVIQKGRYWYLVRSASEDSNKSKLWLVLYIKDDKVNIIFQYREGQLNIVLPWRQAMQRLSVKISEALDYVNRVMLLQNLSETRICNRLLDPESPDDEEWQGASPFQDAEDEGNCLQANLNLVPGKYSCPQVWEKRFMLHPRLIETRGPDVTSRGFLALKLVMSAFAVQNRKNMFVYQDETGTYYMKLIEHISSSRHSSFVKRSNSNQSISSGLQGPRSMSISSGASSQLKARHPSVSASECGELEFPQKNNDFIDLKIYGVSQPGSTITESLVNVLQNKLDEKVVEVLSTILQRNPMSRLMPEDVKFLQPVDSEPSKAIRFVAPTINSDYLPVLCQYLVQNLIESRFISPKFSSSRRENKLRGIGDFDEVLLLNRSKDGGGSSGQIGIGVVAFKFEKRDLGEGSDESCRTLAQLMRIQMVEADSPEDNESKLHFHFYIWELGKLDLEAMITTIHSAVQQAMWDLTLEYVLLSKRFSEFPNVDNTLLTLVNFWLPLGREMHVPALTEKIFKVKGRTNSKFFLEDVYKTIRRIFPTGAIEVYSRFEQGHAPFKRVTEKNYPSPICSSNPVLFSLTIPKSRNLEEFAANPGKSDNLRKFVLTSNSRPRSLHVMVLLHRDQLRVFFYNCSKVVTDRVNRNLQFLMDWTSSRVSLKEALAAQKLGVLKDRDFFDPESDDYQEHPDVEHLLQHSVPQRGQKGPSIGTHAIASNNESLSTLYCNQKRGHLGQRLTSHSTGSLMKDIARLRLDQRHEILPLWIHRRNEVQFFLTEGVLDLVISLSRPIHFCMTPIMFLPKWRMQAHATRFKEGDVDAAEELEDQLLNAKFRGQAQDEMNNNLIIKHYIKEYRQYLEWMSFGAIPCDSAFNVLNPPVAYFYKILAGGLLLFEIGSKEPFIYTKLYALEHTRIQRAAYHKEDLMKAWTSLVMECDRIKFLLHHHSFTYDFHLRALSEFAIGKINILRNGFHLTSFISNFMKYYNKSPNYARNIIFNQQLEIDLSLVQPEQLFNYILSHEKEYGFHVLRMEPLYDEGEGFSNDFLLTTQSSHRVQAVSGEKRITVEFDLTIILSCSKTTAKDSLTLKGVFIFTQKNDQFPILYKEQNHKGIFKPVLGAPFSLANYPVMNHSPNQGEDPIDPENVLYIGYYSSHEQSIQSMVDRESKHLKAKLSQIFQNAERDCRKDTLWRKILLDSTKPSHTIEEYEELVGLIETQATSNPFSSFSFESQGLKTRLHEWLSDYFPLTFRHLSSNYQEHFVITEESMFSVAAVFSIDYGTPETEVSIYSLNRSPEANKKALRDTLCNVISYFLFRETF